MSMRLWHIWEAPISSRLLAGACPISDIPQLRVPYVQAHARQAIGVRSQTTTMDEWDNHVVLHEGVVHLFDQFGALLQLRGSRQVGYQRIVFVAAEAGQIVAQPLVGLISDSLSMPGQGR